MILIVPNGTLPAGEKLKLACMGDSITYGFGLINSDNSYPGLLAKNLPSDWEIRNFGVNGACALSGKDDSYDKTGMVEKINQWDPEIVLFMLGSNDSKVENWVDSLTYLTACKNLIEKIEGYRRVVIIMLPPPAGINFFGIRNEVIQKEIYPALRELAGEKGYPVIDFTEKMKGSPYLFLDNVHPNKYGYTLISGAISKELKSYGLE